MNELKLSLPIQAFRDGDSLLVTRMNHASLLLGTTSVIGNECLYGIVKRPDGLVSIPISSFRKQYDKQMLRAKDIQGKLAVLHIVMKEVGGNDES